MQRIDSKAIEARHRAEHKRKSRIIAKAARLLLPAIVTVPTFIAGCWFIDGLRHGVFAWLDGVVTMGGLFALLLMSEGE